MKKTLISVIAGLFLTSPAWAAQTMFCTLFDLAGGMEIARVNSEHVPGETTTMSLESLGVWGAVVDQPLADGGRDHFVVANNTEGYQISDSVRYVQNDRATHKFPRLFVEAPGIGNNIMFQCGIEEQ